MNNMRSVDTGMLALLAHVIIDMPWGMGNPKLNITEASDAYYRFLFSVVSTYKPRIVVECGCYLGIATEHMAMACDSTHIFTIDSCVKVRAQEVAQRYPNVHLLEGDTVGCAPQVVEYLHKYNEQIGLLFLDSEHDGVTPQKEFDAYKPYFHPDGCIVCCDDILDERMLDFWTHLPGDKLAMNYLHVSKYQGYPEPGFGISIVR